MKKRILAAILSLALMVQALPVFALESSSAPAGSSGISTEEAAPGTKEPPLAGSFDTSTAEPTAVGAPASSSGAKAEEESFAAPEPPAAGISFSAVHTLWDGSSEAEPKQNEAGVYQIGTAAELAWFRTYVNNTPQCSASAVLTANIDLAGYNWAPISTQAAAADKYSGTFDGQFYTISGLSVTGTTASQGLFSDINGATIKNLLVEGNVSSSNNYVGGIVGTTRSSTIENCSFSGSVTYTGSGSHYIGGIIGGNQTNPSVIRGCVNNAAVTGYTAGGILGYSTQKNTIENCYNTGAIKGSFRSGGIVGQATNGSITSCYNTGEIAGASATPGGIYSFSNAALTNCYHLYPESEAPGGTAAKSVKIENGSGLLALLNSSAFVDDNGTNNGYPLLSWQAPPDLTPSISLSGENTLFVQAEAGASETLLSIDTKNIEPAAIEKITWTVETAKGSAAAQDIVGWQTADNDESHLIVRAKKGGVVTVSASVSVSGETLTAARTVSVVPQISTAKIVNVNPQGAVAIGQTVQVRVFVLGGDEYDYENDPPLTFTWRYNSSSVSANIASATGRTFQIPETAGYHEWDSLYVEIMSGGTVVKEAADVCAQLRSADYGKLYPVAYDPSFVLPEKVKEEASLPLPSSHTADGTTVQITWSSDSAAIDAVTGAVTRPEHGTANVTLTARYEYGTAFANRTFKLTLYSKEAAEEESKNDRSYLQQAADSLGKWYSPIIPLYGKDTNIAEMLKTDLSANGYGDLTVAVKSITEVAGGAGLSNSGDIAYFYADPNSTRGLWFGQYKASFVLSRGADCVDVNNLAVNLYWDQAKVQDTMRSEILSGITEDEMLANNENENCVASDLVLPKVIDGKKWAQIEWTSSNPSVIFVSDENQSTADTLFNPYVGKVIRGESDTKVTLTAKIKFQRTVANQPEIILYKTFSFTVSALTGAEADALRAELLSKLDAGFSVAGLSDYVTGEKLTEKNGIYTAANDLQLPTTRDFGVDGKYFPITMISSDEGTLAVPDAANAARVTVYRPPVGASAKTVTLTVSITDLAHGISASKAFDIEVLPLTQAEIEEALALMDRVKTAYFEGLNQNNYTDEFSVTGSLHPFREAVWNADKNGLRWVCDSKRTTKNGIVADELDNWAEQEAWRAFRSSDPSVLDHETLNCVQPAEDTFVRINSVLTHEIYGKYAGMPDYDGLEQLYKQPVSVYVMVAGKNHPARTAEELQQMREQAISEISAPISAQFSLLGTVPQAKARAVSTSVLSSSGVVVQTTVGNLEAGTTVFGLFRKALAEQGYSYKSIGSYVKSVTDANDNTLSEGDGGPNSGWIYTVNGKMPSIYMNGYSLKQGDVVVVRFTNDYTKEDGLMENGGTGDSTTEGGSSGSSGGNSGSAGKETSSESPSGSLSSNFSKPQSSSLPEEASLQSGIETAIQNLAEEHTKALNSLPETLTAEQRQAVQDELDRIYKEAAAQIQAAETPEAVASIYNKAVEDLRNAAANAAAADNVTQQKNNTPLILIAALGVIVLAAAILIGLQRRKAKK